MCAKKQTQSDFTTELERIEDLIQNTHYQAAILKSFNQMEVGLKNIYHQLESHLQRTNHIDRWTALHDEFYRRKGVQFRTQNLTMGSIVSFGHYTNFWNEVKIMVSSNLRFVRMFHWPKMTELRNQKVHEKNNSLRSDALEMMFYTKVFLHETNQVPGGNREMLPLLLDAACPHCSHAVHRKWNYCATCGESLRVACPQCNRQLHKQHRICPYCDHRMVKGTKQNQDIKTYKAYVEAVWADQIVTPLERDWLDQKRLELGLKPEKAIQIEKQVIPENYFIFSQIVEATRVDGVIDKYEEEYLYRKAVDLEIPNNLAKNMIDSTRNVAKAIKRGREKFKIFGAFF